MIKKIVFSVLMAANLISFSQKNKFDSIPPGKIYYTYLGIQSNLLLQQFISFNSNASINTNPFVFSSCKNNIASGEGTAFGTGFSINETTNNDGVASITVKNANVTFRIGYEKKYLQRERLIPFWGVDFGLGGTYTDFVSINNQTFNSGRISVTTTKVFIGPSFRGGLQYAISRNILLGTEFFFNAQIAYSQTVTNQANGFSDSFIPFNIGFQAPTALFLIYRY